MRWSGGAGPEGRKGPMANQGEGGENQTRVKKRGGGVGRGGVAPESGQARLGRLPLAL